MNKRRWLNSTVLGIGVASLFSDIGHEMATTSMPAFLATLGASSLLLGVVEGLADGLSSFAKLLSGLYSDRLARRKPLAVVGYFLTAAGMASFALATSWWHILIGRVGGWIGRGARTPVRNVLLTEATTKETYGRAFGFERAMDSAGAIIGPLLSLLLVATIGMRSMFALTLVPASIAAMLIAVLVREEPHAAAPHLRLFSSMRLLPSTFRRFLVGVGIAGLGDFSNTLLILWATQSLSTRYGLAKGATLAMSLYVGYNVVYTLSCLLAGRLADRFPKQRVLAAGYAIAVIPAVALLGQSPSLVRFAVVFGFSGCYMGFWETLEATSAAELLPAEVRGVGFGVLATVNGIGDLVSSVLVGGLWLVSPIAAMSFVIVTSATGAVIIALSRSSDASDNGDARHGSPRTQAVGAD